MQTGFFDLDTRYAGLDKLKSATGGEPLARLSAAIDWELFRATLETVDAKERKSSAGRKPTDRVVMFKMLILQKLYTLSDEMLEYQVTDRLSFMRFLGFDLNTGVPDARTVWAYREALKAHGLVDKLFAQFDAALIGMGVQLQSGQMIDASFVPAPIQRNNREDNALIKEGTTPPEWSDKKKAHKDVDARWTKKGGQNHYGYKNHINADKQTKLITAYSVTDAAVHDSQEIDDLLHDAKSDASGNKDIWADSAYLSYEREGKLKEDGYNSHICEKGVRDKPLSEEQKETNRKRSKVRARVEHVFGAMEHEMGGMAITTIGIARAKVQVGLKNLAYNLKRVEVLVRNKYFEFSRVSAPKNCQAT